MKKYLMLVVFAALSVVSFAQVPFYIKGGVGISNITGDYIDGTDAKFAWKVGVGTEFPVSGIFSIQPSLYFVDKGYKVGDGLTCHENYLELPIMAAFRVNVDGDTNIVFNAGPYLAYGIGGKNKASLNGKTYEVCDTFGDKGFDKFDAGLGIGITGEFGDFLVGVNAQYGLTKLHENVDAHNLSAFLSVGMRF